MKQLQDTLERLLRLRLAYPLIAALLLAILVTGHISYRRSQDALSMGIVLTDARVAGMRALQLITDAETAQRGFLLAGRPEYLEPYNRALAELPEVLEASLAFVADSGGQQDAANVRRLVDERLAELTTTIALGIAGRREQAVTIVTSDIGKERMNGIRESLGRALDNASARQATVRSYIRDALSFGRWTVVALTLAAAWALFSFMRRLSVEGQQAEQDRKRLEVEVAARTADLRELATHLQTMREDERSRLARELHDELGGLLTAAKLDVARVRAAPGLSGPVAERVQMVGKRIDEVVALKRRIIEDLHPSALDHLGLQASLEILCREVGERLAVPVRCQIDGAQPELGPDGQLTVYRLAQESLTNVQKYAQAKSVVVRLHADAQATEVSITDDGVGFDVAGTRVGRHGLAGMRYRVEALGGRMTLESAPGQGTRIVARLPHASLRKP
jgi:signal transduction histidine kinase